MKLEELKPFSRHDQDYQLDVPSFWPALAQGAIVLLAGVGLAYLSADAIGGTAASPLQFAWGALCFLGGILTVVAAAHRFRRASILSYWIGSGPLRESTGSCRLQQKPDGTWGLRLSFAETLDTEAEFLEILSSGDSESLADGPRSEPSLADPCLFFRLDEAKVAELTRIFDPEQTVSIQWLDLPDAVGGPLLLHMAKTDADQEEDAERELLAA